MDKIEQIGKGLFFSVNDNTKIEILKEGNHRSNNNILNEAKRHLNNLKTMTYEKHIEISEIRSLSVKLFKIIKNKS